MMSDRLQASSANPRVEQLVARFREIGDTAMRDLPLYNANLEVEAVGFRPFDGGWLGVLITPWFMNFVRLPQEPVPIDLTRVGHKVKAFLPSGERELMLGGDEVIGTYVSLSLQSPMSAFKTQEAARQEAHRRLADVMRPSVDPAPDESGRLRVETRRMNRRSFLTAGSS
jgi:[NiFe] hydrogenase assembly HybE family chaperone